MRQYRSWLKEVEEGQETIKGSEQGQQQDPVPDNPPYEGSVVGKASGDGKNEWVTRISRKEPEKVIVKSWPRCQDHDAWRSGTVRAI